MRSFFVLLATGAALFAQAQAPVKTAPKAPADNPLLHPATLKAKAPDSFKVKFVTTHGEFTVEVHRDWSPLGADRFYNLVKNKFFTDAGFFRYVTGFIVQFGIHAKPEIAQQWVNANIPDDPIKTDIHNKPGTLVFATAGPNTRTTQLFINIGDNTRSLDPQHFTPFGEVTDGMEVVKGINSEYGERPNQTLIQSQGKAYLDKNFPKMDFIKSATIEGAAPAAPAAPAAKGPAPAPKGTSSAPKGTAPAVKKGTTK
jgi:peptidyl-prolyl cis-trans isomerase A (cyclophilin A)